ncbi:MAG: STAS domain-containing protein [Desulfobacterales bacterium]|jgi:anti-anti-sigma factor
METRKNRKHEIVCMTVKSRTETEISPEFEVAIKKIVEGDNRRLLLDLSALKYLKSSQLRVILNAVKEIDRKSGKVVLCSLNAYVKEVFEVNCHKDIIAIADSVEAGFNALLYV